MVEAELLSGASPTWARWVLVEACWVNPVRVGEPVERHPSFANYAEIIASVSVGWGVPCMAQRVERAPSTVSRELTRTG